MFFFFNDTATTEIYTLSLHDALPICGHQPQSGHLDPALRERPRGHEQHEGEADEQEGQRELRDRKSTRLNSSHSQISYAVFCLKKKKTERRNSPESTQRYLDSAKSPD